MKGKVAIVTGAGSGIGTAPAALFAEEGAAVLATDRNVRGAEQVASDEASFITGANLAVDGGYTAQ